MDYLTNATIMSFINDITSMNVKMMSNNRAPDSIHDFYVMIYTVEPHISISFGRPQKPMVMRSLH